jgi:hypothetical protein
MSVNFIYERIEWIAIKVLVYSDDVERFLFWLVSVGYNSDPRIYFYQFSQEQFIV